MWPVPLFHYKFSKVLTLLMRGYMCSFFFLFKSDYVYIVSKLKRKLNCVIPNMILCVYVFQKIKHERFVCRSYEGKWIKTPQLVYEEKYIAARREIASDMIDYYKIEDDYTKNLEFVAVKQLLVKGPCRKIFLVEGSEGIKILQSLLNEQFNVIHIFAVDDFEEPISAPTLFHHTEAYFIECEYETDAESETNSDDNGESNDEEYNSGKLEVIKMQQNIKLNEKLDHYK